MRIFTGIQPTGAKHLGNYIGAIRQYVEGQDRGEAIYCIVDLHAITVDYEPAELRERVHDTTAILLAAGLDPERCILFRQSDVQEHTELAWLLGAVTAWGDLNRMHQWKDKRELLEGRQGAFVSAGLFTYPVLQAADVLAYRANEVPVGDDQRQHIELMREIARRFNERFGGGEEVLVVPEHRIPEIGARIMDLQEPLTKMATTGGTEGGTVLVLDEPGRRPQEGDERRHRLRLGGPPRRGQARDHEPDRHPRRHPGRRPGRRRGRVRGLGVRGLQGRGRGGGRRATWRRCASATRTFARTRARWRRRFESGAEKARAIASETLADVRDRMGVGPPR